MQFSGVLTTMMSTMCGWSNRSCLFAALLLLAAGGPARAGESVPSVAILAPSCTPEILDGDALVAALRATLPAALGTATTVRLGADERATYRIELDCSDDSIEATVTRAQPHATVQTRISLAHVLPAARPETVARALNDETAALGARPVAPAAVAPLLPVLSPVTRERRVRVTRDLAIVGAALTVGCVVIGAPLVAVGTETKPDTRPALTAGGAVLLGIGGAALITTAVGLGLWLHERHRP